MAHLLDIDQLRTLIAIADTGSFTKAADVVHKTQSAVSMQMKRLEERVGRDIFEKDGRASRLTEDGERLLDYARRIVQLNHDCILSFSDAALSGRVKLGVPDDYADRYLPEILARFTRTNCKVEVTVICEPTPMLVERLQANELDLAIITHSDHRGPAEVIRHERLLWVTSSRSQVHEETPVPLALGRPTCNWRQAATERWSGSAGPSACSTPAGTRPRWGPPSRRASPSRSCRKAQYGRECACWGHQTVSPPCLGQDRADAQPPGAIAPDGETRGAYHLQPRQPVGTRAGSAPALAAE